MKQTTTNPLVGPLSLLVGLFLALCIGVGVRLQNGHPPGLPPNPFAHLLDRSAPSFQLEGLEGEPVSLERNGAKGAQVLFFTDSGCRACDATYGALAEAARQVPVLIVGVGDRQQLKDKLAQNKIGAPAGFDSLRTTWALYGIRGTPTTLLIDAQGVVRRAGLGTQGVREVMAAWNEASKKGS
jgi:peroxiredoxin